MYAHLQPLLLSNRHIISKGSKAVVSLGEGAGLACPHLSTLSRWWYSIWDWDLSGSGRFVGSLLVDPELDLISELGQPLGPENISGKMSFKLLIVHPRDCLTLELSGASGNPQTGCLSNRR